MRPMKREQSLLSFLFLALLAVGGSIRPVAAQVVSPDDAPAVVDDPESGEPIVQGAAPQAQLSGDNRGSSNALPIMPPIQPVTPPIGAVSPPAGAVIPPVQAVQPSVEPPSPPILSGPTSNMPSSSNATETPTGQK